MKNGRRISSRRASSIRTRIKTFIKLADLDSLYLLAEHLPLEQGLRLLIDLQLHCCGLHLAEHLPLEQGLRPSSKSL